MLKYRVKETWSCQAKSEYLLTKYIHRKFHPLFLPKLCSSVMYDMLCTYVMYDMLCAYVMYSI